MQNTPDLLPPLVRLLSPAAVAQLVGLSIATIDRLRKRGLFPQPVRLSTQRVGYHEADIVKWMQTREVAR